MNVTKAQDWIARLAGARVVLDEVHEVDAHLRAEHTAAVEERNHIINAPPPVEDVIAAMERDIDTMAATWGEKRARALLAAYGSGLKEKDDGSHVVHNRSFPGELYLPWTEADWASANPDAAKQRYAAEIRARPYVAGPPVADRLRLVAQADARIRELEDHHAEFVETAAKFDPPIILALLPGVAKRKEDDARALALAAKATEAQRAREAPLSERYERRVARPHFSVPSPRSRGAV
jgi:hypothetical protein